MPAWAGMPNAIVRKWVWSTGTVFYNSVENFVEDGRRLGVSAEPARRAGESSLVGGGRIA